jgi:lactate dehydrogenase-like 2-hydroxyacid dehydrogenase
MERRKYADGDARVVPIRAVTPVVVPDSESLTAAARLLDSVGRVTILAGAGCAGAHEQPATRHMIGPAAFGKMKPGAILINVARGQIVDQAALLDALRSQRIAGAGLDVFAVEPLPLDDPLLAMDNVVLTPHVAAATYETSRRRGAAAAQNVQRVARGDQPLFVVT